MTNTRQLLEDALDAAIDAKVIDGWGISGTKGGVIANAQTVPFTVTAQGALKINGASLPASFTPTQLSKALRSP